MAKRLPTETFFMLTPNVRDRLLECNLTAAEWRMWCYLVSLDPFGDSGAKFSPPQLMLKCGMKKSTYFTAKAKFQNLGLFDFQDGVTKVFNLQRHSAKTNYSQQAQIIESENLESQSENLESQSENLESQSENLESQSLNPLLNKDSSFSQTIQTIPDPPDRTGGEEKFSLNSDVLISKNESHQALTGLNSIFENRSLVYSSSEKEDTNFPLCSTADFEISTLSQVKSQGNPQKRLTPELMAKLEELKIPLDGAVRKAIAQSHPSQIWSALQHIEDTWDEIKSPKGVFLYQVPLQSKEQRKAKKDPFTPEFREWYRTAIADGLVVNRSIESLGLHQFVEPIVQLPDGSQWPWTQVRDGKVIKPTDQERQQGFNQELLEQLKQKASCSSIGYKYLSSQEKARLEVERYRKSQELGGYHVST